MNSEITQLLIYDILVENDIDIDIFYFLRNHGYVKITKCFIFKNIKDYKYINSKTSFICFKKENDPTEFTMSIQYFLSEKI